VNGGLESLPGYEQVFGTPPIAPHLAMPVVAPSQTFWLYVGLQKGYAYDGVSHTNITRQSAGVDVNYTATQTRQWNGTFIAGIPILNNGVDVPQFWGGLSVGTKLANLTNWPSTLRARVVRAFGAYLVAINILDGSNAYPSLVRWSDEVKDPGTLPASWDYTDPSNQSGLYNLPDVNSGKLLEALPMAGRLYLLKESSLWSMRWVGGSAIFSFDSVSDTMGILATRCACLTGDGSKMVIATQDDLVSFDGQKATSILEKRMRSAIFNDLDTDNYVNSFLFCDPEFNEVWFCYPQQGQTDPNRAVIFNYKTGAITEADVSFRNAAVGVIEESSDEVWDFGTATWDTADGNWSTAKRRELVLVDPVRSKFYQANQGVLRDGVPFNTTLQRIGISVTGRSRTGDWNVDHNVAKLLRRVWPKIQGGPVRMRIGFQDLVNGPITWKEVKTFDPASQLAFDDTCTGKALAIEFSTDTPVQWRIDGYGLDIKQVGAW